MSSVPNRAHSFSFKRNSLVVVIKNIVMWFLYEVINRIELFAIELFNLQSSEEVFHGSLSMQFALFRRAVCPFPPRRGSFAMPLVFASAWGFLPRSLPFPASAWISLRAVHSSRLGVDFSPHGSLFLFRLGSFAARFALPASACVFLPCVSSLPRRGFLSAQFALPASARFFCRENRFSRLGLRFLGGVAAKIWHTPLAMQRFCGRIKA